MEQKQTETAAKPRIGYVATILCIDPLSMEAKPFRHEAESEVEIHDEVLRLSDEYIIRKISVATVGRNIEEGVSCSQSMDYSYNSWMGCH